MKSHRNYLTTGNAIKTSPLTTRTNKNQHGSAFDNITRTPNLLIFKVQKIALKIYFHKWREALFRNLVRHNRKEKAAFNQRISNLNSSNQQLNSSKQKYSSIHRSPQQTSPYKSNYSPSKQ